MSWPSVCSRTPPSLTFSGPVSLLPSCPSRSRLRSDHCMEFGKNYESPIFLLNLVLRLVSVLRIILRVGVIFRFNYFGHIFFLKRVSVFINVILDVCLTSCLASPSPRRTAYVVLHSHLDSVTGLNYYFRY